MVSLCIKLGKEKVYPFHIGGTSRSLNKAIQRNVALLVAWSLLIPYNAVVVIPVHLQGFFTLQPSNQSGTFGNEYPKLLEVLSVYEIFHIRIFLQLKYFTGFFRHVKQFHFVQQGFRPKE